MRRSTRLVRNLYPFILVAALAGCETGGGGSSSVSASPHGGGGSMVEQGRKLYVGRCTACHSPEPVRDYTRAEWATIIPEMSEESKLKPAQVAALRAYVDSLL